MDLRTRNFKTLKNDTTFFMGFNSDIVILIAQWVIAAPSLAYESSHLQDEGFKMQDTRFLSWVTLTSKEKYREISKHFQIVRTIPFRGNSFVYQTEIEFAVYTDLFYFHSLETCLCFCRSYVIQYNTPFCSW